MTTPIASRAAGRRWAVVTAVSGTVFIAAGAFWLSFTALVDLAARSGVGAGQAWAWPLIVDGIIVVATVAVVALAGQKTAWYPWALLIGGAAVSDPTASSPAVLDAPSTSQPRELTTPRTAGEPAHRAGRNVPDTSTSAPALERRDRAADLRGAGWSNKRIARELGVHPSTVGRWFTGAHLPDMRTPEMTDGEEATR